MTEIFTKSDREIAELQQKAITDYTNHVAVSPNITNVTLAGISLLDHVAKEGIRNAKTGLYAAELGRTAGQVADDVNKLHEEANNIKATIDNYQEILEHRAKNSPYVGGDLNEPSVNYNGNPKDDTKMSYTWDGKPAVETLGQAIENQKTQENPIKTKTSEKVDGGHKKDDLADEPHPRNTGGSSSGGSDDSGGGDTGSPPRGGDGGSSGGGSGGSSGGSKGGSSGGGSGGSSGGSKGGSSGGGSGGSSGGSKGGSSGGSTTGSTGSSGDFNCFAAGTRILLLSGKEKPIEDVYLGDLVMAFDGFGELVGREVTDLFIHGKRSVIDVDGIKTTPEHPFLTEAGEYAPIGSFKVGDKIVRVDGSLHTIQSITEVPGLHTVYNFTVADLHTYVADGYRVHNKVPVVIDLDGDGVEIIEQTDSPVLFDGDDDGFVESTAWAGKDDAFLFWDKNGDGEMHSASQIAFANLTEEDTTDTDLQALATVFDSNKDGVFNKDDAKWQDFKLWQDKNSNGRIDEGELATLDEHGIVEIGLDYPEGSGRTLADGSVIHGTAQAKRADGSTLSVGDVAFATGKYGYQFSKSDQGFQIETNSGAKIFTASGSEGHSLTFDKSVYAFGTQGADNFDASASEEAVYLAGAAGDDRLSGGNKADILTGGEGDDHLIGNGGYDILIGGAGADTIEGWQGFDLAFYTNSSTGVTVNLTTGEASGGDAEGDSITGVEGLIGSAHADRLTGDDLDNWLNGGKGNDVLSGGKGNDTLAGAEGADALIGGEGDDRADYSTSTSAVVADLASGRGSSGDAAGDTYSGVEGLIGSAFDDSLKGDAGNNRLQGNHGDDVLSGRAGNDRLDGGAGTDVLLGGTGDDTYLVGYGHELVGISDYGTRTTVTETRFLAGYHYETPVYGTRTTTTTVAINGGNDTLQFAQNVDLNDVSFQKDGLDLIITLNGKSDGGEIAPNTLVKIDRAFDSRYAIETIKFGYSLTLDTSKLVKAAADGTFEGSVAADVFFGSDSDDSVIAGAGNDQIVTGLGDDTVSAGEGEDLIWSGFGDDTVTAGSGNDLISGGHGDDHLAGEEGDDGLSGGFGDDVLLGGEGDDLLMGDTGDDTLQGGAGKDQLYGGEGHDLASYADASTAVTVNLSDLSKNTGAAAEDIYHSIEGVVGSHGRDHLTGSALDNTIRGLGGNDAIYGEGGNDTLEGGAGDDSISGGKGDDTLRGGEGKDNLYGGEGDDTLEGGAGDDYLRGDSGNDTLRGGEGKDTLDGS
ncbi:polymorphic toxin-type HINT domain-containing protein, partial [Polycladidibacter hongkongensis]|uniref:polymorphic toxin-type HINT domain-containing protein n=1 Tax=Polycladidibacter hongkongensis TaxID=1647556 RepID=UPI000AF34EF3